MVDMTGGVGEGLEIADFRSQDQRMRLFSILYKAKANQSLMCSAIQVVCHPQRYIEVCVVILAQLLHVMYLKNFKVMPMTKLLAISFLL